MPRHYRMIGIGFGLSMASAVLAQPTTQPIAPATQPSAVAAPATQPIVAGPARVLLLPFTAIDSADKRDWIGRGVLASLQSDLSRLGSIQPITVDTTKPENAPTASGYDTETALKIGRTVDARFVIYGTYQTVEPELRLVGFILDTETGRAIGGMKATGSIRDIFGMEDSLGNQAKRQFPQLPVVAQVAPVAPVAAPAAPAPVVAAPPPAINLPVQAPVPPVVFDDDAARRVIERVRNHDDSTDYPPVSNIGYGPIIGTGWTPVLYPVSPFQPVSPPPVSSGNPFRGNNYLAPTPQSGNYIRPTPQSGNFISPTPQSGNYIRPTPQSGNFISPTPQHGNAVRATPQSGNYVAPTPQSGNAAK